MKKRLSKFLDKQGWLAYTATLAGVAAAGLVETTAAYAVHIADWYMHLAMWVLIAVYYLLAINVISARKRIRGWLNIIVLEVLSVFWITILLAKIPSERIVLNDDLVMREPLTAAWISVVLLALSALSVLVFAVTNLSQANDRAATEK